MGTWLFTQNPSWSQSFIFQDSTSLAFVFISILAELYTAGLWLKAEVSPLGSTPNFLPTPPSLFSATQDTMSTRRHHVEYRFNFKLLVLIFKALHWINPGSLYRAVTLHNSCVCVCSLSPTRATLKSAEDRTFSAPWVSWHPFLYLSHKTTLSCVLILMQ